MDGSKVLTIPNMSAGFAVIWGLWAMNPFGDMFALSPRLYSPMLSLVPYEAFWGGLFAGCGVATWILSYYGHKYKGAFVLFVVYGLFAALYFLGEPRSAAGTLYSYLSLCHFLYFGAHRWKISH